MRFGETEIERLRCTEHRCWEGKRMRILEVQSFSDLTGESRPFTSIRNGNNGTNESNAPVEIVPILSLRKFHNKLWNRNPVERDRVAFAGRRLLVMTPHSLAVLYPVSLLRRN